MTRSDELDRLMRDNDLTARQVGKLVDREPQTVRNWRSSADRPIPAHALEVLRAKLAAGVKA